MLLSIRKAAVVGLGLALAATGAWAGGDADGGASGEPEFADVTLTRLDGSTMTRNYEKPRYGGTITMNREILLVSFSIWDPRSGGGPHEQANVQVENGRALIDRQFTFSQRIRKVEDIYEEVLGIANDRRTPDNRISEEIS